MSTTVEVRAVARKRVTGRPWAIWYRQILAILRMELSKILFNRRSLLIYLMVMVPVFILFMMGRFPEVSKEMRDPNEAVQIFSFLYEGLILRAIVYFGCVWLFMNLFRGELIDRSLHYYFLAPLRREVLVVGKYLSGLFASMILFCSMTFLSLFFLYQPRGYDASMDHLFNGPGLKIGLTYIGITAMACIGYGAVFLLIGLFIRNPIVPAAIVYWWEMINFLLPPVLKKVSVIHYLISLQPVPIQEGPFAVVGDPTPAYISIPGLLIFTALVLFIAAFKIRKMEIKYANE